MKIFIVLLLVLSIPCLLAINTPCSTNAGCPANSVCVGSYCQCTTNYILDCSTQAEFLTSDPVAAILTQTNSYYQTPSA